MSKGVPNVRIKRAENIYLIFIDTPYGIETIKVLTFEAGLRIINILAGFCQTSLKIGQSIEAKFIFNSRLYKGLKINVRVEFLPVSSKLDKDNALFEAVLRLHGLNKMISLESLGFSGHQIDILKASYTYPYGFIIATGPTGSGKSTTFYALLKLLSQKKKAIMTIEDPVEIELKEPNITQMNISDSFSYADALRAMLRSEPHIIMIGEVRDEVTAKYALSAAQTGHLVLTTLHTQSALSIFNRLKSLDIDINQFVESVRIVTGQRLYSPLCPECKREISLKDLPSFYRSILEKALLININLYVKGNIQCNLCGSTGFEKRKAITEIAVFTDDIKKEIFKKLEIISNIGQLEEFFIEKGDFEPLKIIALNEFKKGNIDPLTYFSLAG